MAEKKRFELRVSDDQFNVLKRTAQARGIRSVSAYVQAATTKNTAILYRPVRSGSIRVRDMKVMMHEFSFFVA